MADIVMGVDEKLELDSSIESLSNPESVFDSKPDGGKFNIDGFKTSTVVLDPKTTGTSTITINGTDYTIEVVDVPRNAVDDFEQNRISNYGGNTGRASIVTTPSIQRDQALRISNGQFGDGITSTSGLQNYPQQGRKFQCWVYLTEPNQNANFIYYANEEKVFPSDSYQVQIDAEIDTFEIPSNTKSFAASNHIGEWLRIVGRWGNDNTHSFKLKNSNGDVLVSAESTDSTYDNVSDVGVGFRNGNGADNSSPMYFDGCFTSVIARKPTRLRVGGSA